MSGSGKDSPRLSDWSSSRWRNVTCTQTTPLFTREDTPPAVIQSKSYDDDDDADDGDANYYYYDDYDDNDNDVRTLAHFPDIHL